MLDSGGFIGYNGFTIKLLEVTAMLKTHELAMPRSRKVMTVCNGRHKVWSNYKKAKAYFFEMMMTAEDEEREHAKCVFIQLIHGLSVCSDKNE
jgi:hypothetical protein